jgi:hypothetical protein
MPRPLILILILLLLPTACAVPYVPQPPGPWSGSPEANDWNLSVMVANPQDLAYGQSATASLGNEAVPPIRRLLSGQRTPLMQVTAEQIFPAGQAPAQAQGGAVGVGQ